MAPEIDGHELLVRIDERLKGLSVQVQKIEEYIEKVDNKVDKLERRTDDLENWRSRMKGSITVLSAIAAAFTAIVLKLLGL